MLSDFEVAKPNQEFSQVHLDSFEVLLESIKAKLFLSKDVIHNGVLHLTTRGLIFQPKEDALSLLKFKFSDGTSAKLSKMPPEHTMMEIGKKYLDFLTHFTKTYKGGKPFKHKRGSHQLNKGRGNTLVVKGNRFIMVERNPPAPFSVEVINSYFLFITDGNLKSHNSSFGNLDEKNALFEFERMTEKVRKTDDEERFVDEIYLRRLNETKLATRKKKDLEFFYPIQIIQTFEKFKGYIYLTENKKIKVGALVNDTKNFKLKFSCREVKWINLYNYFFEKRAIEVFLYTTNLSYLLVFNDTRRAEKVYKLLLNYCKEVVDVQLDVVTKTWSQNLMSNFDYLMYLNRMGGRSFNDTSRYPIFPWVISDFSSESLKMNSKDQYRDLNKPVGAQTKSSSLKAQENYDYLKNDPVPVKKPFHFGSYISTPGYVNYFYIRSVPSLVLKLQSGAFAPGDRVFRGFETLWLSMFKGGTQYTELIPEFYCPNKMDLFLNKYRIDLGSTPEGSTIDDVEVANWATGIEDFMYKMKAALESEHCSLNLHNWIDLTFGVKAHKEAVDNTNQYGECCYGNSYRNDIESASPLKREALKLQAMEYGQIPIQLFDGPHPKKKIKAQIVIQPNSNSITNHKDNSEERHEEESFPRQNSTNIFHKLEQLRENFEISNTHNNIEIESNNIDKTLSEHVAYR